MSALKRSFTVLTVLGLAVSGWFFLGSATELEVAQVLRDIAIDAVPAAVKVDPEFQVTITSDVAGLVRKSNVKRGQRVKEGDMLFEIDSSKYALELEQMKLQLENTRQQFALNLDQRTALERRKEDLENFAKRTASGEYPEIELKRRTEEFAMFQEGQARERLGREQQLTNMAHAIKLKQKDIDDCALRSPASGTITEIFAQPGEVIGVRAALVRLYSDALLVEARINEEDFSGIRPGLDASVRFLAYGPELYTAKVVKVLPNADPQNQQYRAYLEVEIAADRLIPGLSGEASILRNRRTNTLVAPRAALLNGAVFVVENGVVRRQPVEIGFRSLTAIEIIKGVKEGDVVALTGLDGLRDGQRVQVRK
ncbi:MAG: efflux RND transporter periplasmic adaptor subunit [Verrucomicrobia bacterium]|nr:efflux RND transporter periplasmic adaptor subunit [Verrucomicrobiota bacterium]